jgi:hypothetical protein
VGVLIAIAVLFVAVSASATEYVVDVRSPAASDENPGAIERPFRTIQHAADVARAGDTVKVVSGVYRESVILEHSGETDRPITFSAESGVVLTGADILTGWERVPGDEPIYRAPWPHRFIINHTPDGDPIEHHPEDAPVWGRAEQVIASGSQLAPVASVDGLRAIWPALQGARGRSAIPTWEAPATWAGAFTADTDSGQIYALLANGADPNADGSVMEASARGLVFGTNPWMNREGVHDIHVQGFTFRYAASFPQRGAVWLHGANNVLKRCRIEQMSGGGVSVSGEMRECVVRDNGHVGGGAGDDGFLNEDCLWQGNSWKPINRQWEAGGFKMSRVDGGVFRDCMFWGNGGPGLWLDIDVANVVITDCGFVNNEQSGVFIEISHDITVEDSWFFGNGVGRGLQVEEAGWAVGGIQIAESMDCVITGNALFENKDGITLREQGPRLLDGVPFYNRGHRITGNTLDRNEGYQLALWYDNAFFGWHPAERERFPAPPAYEQHLMDTDAQLYDPIQQGMMITGNVYIESTELNRFLLGVPWRPGHAVVSSLAAFREATGFERGDADPRAPTTEPTDLVMLLRSMGTRRAMLDAWP